MVAANEVTLAQSRKDNAPPDKSVFEHMHNIAKSHEYLKGFETNLSNLREKKNAVSAIVIRS